MGSETTAEEFLKEARERLESAEQILKGLRTLLGAESNNSLKEDLAAVRGALVLVQESVQGVMGLIQKVAQEIDGQEESE